MAKILDSILYQMEQVTGKLIGIYFANLDICITCVSLVSHLLNHMLLDLETEE